MNVKVVLVDVNKIAQTRIVKMATLNALVTMAILLIMIAERAQVQKNFGTNS